MSDLWFAGGYTDGGDAFPGSRAKGIVSFRFDANRGQFSDYRLQAITLNPSWISCQNGHLLAVTEGLGEDGAVSLYQIHPDGGLQRRHHLVLTGDALCHAGWDGDQAVISSYMSGWIHRLRVDLQAGVCRPVSQYRYTGSGPHWRQEKPHAHQATFCHHLKSWLVCDLGTDRVWIHDETWTAPPRSLSLPAGCGPRHLCPDHRDSLYWLWCELEPRLFRLDLRSEPFRCSEVSLRDVPNLGSFGAGAAIHAHPVKPWIGLASRGDHSLLLLDVSDQEQPTYLSRLEHAGRTPREFRFDPSGSWLLVASQDEHRIQSFALSPEGHVEPCPSDHLQTGSPSCLVQPA